MKRILIFTSLTGGGHVSQAEALSDLLRPEFDVIILDPQPGLIHWHYRMVSRHALWLWKAEYRLSQGHRRAGLAHAMSSLALARRVADALKQTGPDLVMTTYPFLTSEVTFAMRRSNLRRPLVMLFSDSNRIHPSWLTERHADMTFAPTQETFQQALEAGFDPARLYFTGLPVRRQFTAPDLKTRLEVLPLLGLNPKKFTVFAQGGWEGAARFAGMIAALAALPDLQIIMAAGTNEGLIRHFSGLPNVHPLPFTKQIARYMNAADVIMGKPGASMLFEAVTLGKPFIATTFIPGQEEGNLEFIERHGIGRLALDARTQQQLIQRLIHDPEMLVAMAASVDRYRWINTEATRRIPGLVKTLLEGAPTGMATG
jgi:UDP-N-acetylglucosamine:LPS N-acetylglucosamine transferase